MTENTPTVGGDGAGGNQPPVSNQPIEGEAERLSKLFDSRLSEALKPVLAEVRGVQSRQDKDRKGFQEILDEFKKLKAKGLSDEEAESAMIEGRKATEKDDLLYKMAQKLGVLESPSTQLAGNGVSGADERARLVASAEVDPNSPEVIQALRDEPDPLKFAIKLGEIRGRAGRQALDPATAPTPQGGPAHSAPDTKQVTQEYIAEALKRRGKPAELKALKESYRARGADVDHVQFST